MRSNLFRSINCLLRKLIYKYLECSQSLNGANNLDMFDSRINLSSIFKGSDQGEIIQSIDRASTGVHLIFYICSPFRRFHVKYNTNYIKLINVWIIKEHRIYRLDFIIICLLRNCLDTIFQK